MFYDIFTELCDEKGVTPTTVRKELGISQSTMASWKSRGLNPSASSLVQLAEYFGTTPAYLLGNRYARYPSPIPLARDLPKIDTVAIDLDKIHAEIDKKSVSETGKTLDELEREYWEDQLLPGGLFVIKQAFDSLNREGQKKAIERVQELTEIPKYQAKKQQ